MKPFTKRLACLLRDRVANFLRLRPLITALPSLVRQLIPSWDGTKRLALVMGLLFTALICMGIVYIDTVNNYWQFSGGFIRLVVNTNAQASVTVATNSGYVGVNSNNTTFGVLITARALLTTNGATGNNAQNAGQVLLAGAAGGSTTNNASGTGGAGGRITLNGGAGGNATSATTNSTGGGGGGLFATTGTGGENSVTEVSTNSSQGGAGGAVQVVSGGGGSPSGGATNTVGGGGGPYTFTSGDGGSPGGGWARKGGNGGQFSFLAGGGGMGLRTNGGDGAALNFTAGTAGGSSLAGNAGKAGPILITGGSGGTTSGGGTNSNGGTLYLAGGTAGSGAVPGDVVIARTEAGTSGGGLMIGPLMTGGAATVTNMLGAAASLDFPSTAAGTVSDLVITVMGVTSNNCAVSLSVPWQVLTGNGGLFTTYNSNDTIYVRFVNNNLVTAIDPTPGTFAVVGFRIR